MMVYILVDDNHIVRCLATNECNLHKDKLTMNKFYVELQGRVGDEYRNGKWTAKPENYPKPTEEELNEQKISDEIRAMAIERLKDREEIPSDFE